MNKIMKAALFVIPAALFLSSCSPKVQVEAPEKPITINLNVKIEHEIKVQIEKELDSILSEDSGLF